MERTLKLVYLDTMGDKYTILIPYIKSDITNAEIRTLSDAILQSNIFGDEVRSLDKAVEAVLTSKDTTTLTF